MPGLNNIDQREELRWTRQNVSIVDDAVDGLNGEFVEFVGTACY